MIDHAILLAYSRKQFAATDFELIKSEYHLKKDKTADYYQVFYNALIERRIEIFKYIQSYYRCFMGCKSVITYPEFIFK